MCIVPPTIPSRRHSHRPRLSINFHLSNNTNNNNNNRYLELDDWILKDAVRSAREDNEWEQDIDANELKSGEIRFTMNKMGLHAAGAGIRKNGGVEPKEFKAKDEKMTVVEKPKVIAYEGIPAIATKTVKAQDVYKAAQQHDNVGLELLPILVQKQTIQEIRLSR
jgi:hypothetical protein